MRWACTLGLALLTVLPVHAAADTQLRALLTRQDYAAAAPLANALLAKPAPSNAERALIHAWLFARDDLAEIDRRTRGVLDDAAALPADLQAAGRLALERRDFDRAQTCFERALKAATQADDRAAALKGLGQVAYQRRDYDGSLALLRQSTKTKATPDGLTALADTLIRLGRTDQAIAAAEQAVALNPHHDAAHYLLGNGYARKNYTQLAAHCGPALQQAEALTRQASDAFDQGDFAAARRWSGQALQRCGEYGRAHAVLAKALESQRFQIDVHRADYERRFDALPMPEVPGIDRYVLNWSALSPRHQKRVALSVAPWKAFVPVLVEGGSRHFIKPMYMRLSEVPGMQTLKDQRINYDSRLWDDVRGAGGYTTVTGIEDVERTIFDRYNTVLHELTHQVHGVLTADQARAIQELYRRAKERDEATRQGFLSRYAGGSVWEYFAEGANALESPRRDAYDAREIVRERLAAMDPDLMALVSQAFTQTDVAANLPIALANAGNDQLENGRVDPALVFFERALKVAPDDEAVLAASLYGLALKGNRAGVQRTAERALALHPGSGNVRTTAADALWHAGQGMDAALAVLAMQPETLKGEDRFRVDLALGDYRRKRGDVTQALAAYDAVLAYQSDNPEGLWGKAATLALAERWDEGFAMYERVIRLRTGVVALRTDYVRDLLRAGQVERARGQLAEVKLLDANDPTAMALEGWVALMGKDAAGALRWADAALKQGPWCDLAVIVKGAALRALGRASEADVVLAPLHKRIADGSAPEYVYRADQSTWISVHEGTAVEVELLKRLAASV